MFWQLGKWLQLADNLIVAEQEMALMEDVRYHKLLSGQCRKRLFNLDLNGLTGYNL
jgi:hypothetical protein